MSPQHLNLRKKCLLELSEIFLSTHERLMSFVRYNTDDIDDPASPSIPPEVDAILHKYLSDCELLELAKTLSKSAMKNE